MENVKWIEKLDITDYFKLEGTELNWTDKFKFSTISKDWIAPAMQETQFNS